MPPSLVRVKYHTFSGFSNDCRNQFDHGEQIAKLATVNPEALHIIARSREWTRSMTVCRNLVHNPKTPLADALEMLEHLPPSEIRMLAKSGNVRTPLQQAARKKVIK